jgi:hypothetical protein
MVNPTFIQDCNHKTNPLEARDSIVRSPNSMVRSPHTLKPKIAEIEKIKIIIFLIKKSVFFHIHSDQKIQWSDLELGYHLF